MVLYPLGYPVLIESAAAEPLRIAEASWGGREARFDAPPLRLTIHTAEGPAPSGSPAYRACADGFTLECDSVSRGAFSIRAQAACLHVSRGVLSRPEWFRHHLLECMVLTALDTIYFVGLHAACVVPPGPGKPGLLLCGASGSGKSTLAYACVRAGWTFVSDDSHLAPGGQNRVTGNSPVIRLREPARELFLELSGRPTVTAPNGKKCIEVELSADATVPDAPVGHCVFLDRRPGPAILREYSQDAAVDYFMGYNTRFDGSGAEQALREMLRKGVWTFGYERLEDALDILGRLP